MTLTELIPSCQNKYKALMAGAAVHVIGADRLFAGFGAPPAVHWALAGTASDVYCNGGDMSDTTQMVYCAIGGYIGGIAATYVFGR
jgi:hypothetical protein